MFIKAVNTERITDEYWLDAAQKKKLEETRGAPVSRRVAKRVE